MEVDDDPFRGPAGFPKDDIGGFSADTGQGGQFIKGEGDMAVLFDVFGNFDEPICFVGKVADALQVRETTLPSWLSPARTCRDMP